MAIINWTCFKVVIVKRMVGGRYNHYRYTTKGRILSPILFIVNLVLFFPLVIKYGLKDAIWYTKSMYTHSDVIEKEFHTPHGEVGFKKALSRFVKIYS